MSQTSQKGCFVYAATAVILLLLVSLFGALQQDNVWTVLHITSTTKAQPSAAVVFFGLAGFISEAARNQETPGNLDAIRFAYNFTNSNLIDYNRRQHGWRVDTFFHVWQEELAEEIATLYESKQHVAGPGTLNGQNVTGGPGASIELGMSIVPKHTYDRIFIIRHDAALLRPFSFDDFRDNEAVYVAQWCKAIGPIVERPGVHLCRELQRNPSDTGGVPDFWFGGSDKVLRGLFTNFTSDFNRGIVQKGETYGFHGQMWGRIRFKGLRMQRYRFHHADYDLARSLSPMPSRIQCAEKGLLHFQLRNNKSMDPVMMRNYSDNTYCENSGHALCACTAGEEASKAFSI